jgi:hypothetical protein
MAGTIDKRGQDGLGRRGAVEWIRLPARHGELDPALPVFMIPFLKFRRTTFLGLHSCTLDAIAALLN